MSETILKPPICTKSSVLNIIHGPLAGGCPKVERGKMCIRDRYQMVFEEAIKSLEPHIIATYLYELTQVFNRFYENNRVLDDDRSPIRIRLVKNYQRILRSGLEILNIDAPEKI